MSGPIIVFALQAFKRHLHGTIDDNSAQADDDTVSIVLTKQQVLITPRCQSPLVWAIPPNVWSRVV